MMSAKMPKKTPTFQYQAESFDLEAYLELLIECEALLAKAERLTPGDPVMWLALDRLRMSIKTIQQTLVF